MELTIVLTNSLYAIIGGAITILFLFIGFKSADHLTRVHAATELAKRNQAVGMMVRRMLAAWNQV
ncbi:DUF350 domain-containing protein [candidate division KSB1 bacterium]|nr:DUF350 domain-containing protein [candidate division KSB1 bacterium]